jgi:hypothetical protein
MTISFPEYSQYEKLVYSAIYSVWGSIGGDLPEMLACSGMMFVKACQTYKPDCGMSIGSWIRKVTWDDTYAARRIHIGREKRYEKGEFDLMMVADRVRFDLANFMDDLSDDARNLVLLALNPVETIALKDNGVPKRNSFYAVAKRMFCWSDEQLREVVQEIAECL